MYLKELVEFLSAHIEKHPEDTDKDIFWMQLDLAAEKENTRIADNNGQLEICNGFLNPYEVHGWSRQS